MADTLNIDEVLQALGLSDQQIQEKGFTRDDADPWRFLGFPLGTSPAAAKEAKKLFGRQEDITKLVDAINLKSLSSDLVNQDERRQQKISRDAFLGGPTFGDMSPMVQDVIKSLGGQPTKSQEVNTPAAGPTRPIFDHTLSTRGGRFVEDEFGGHFESSGQFESSLRPDVRMMLATGNQATQDVLRTLANDPHPSPESEKGPFVENLMRQIDPGLNATETIRVTDPKGFVDEAVKQQAELALKTRLQTQTQIPQTIPQEMAKSAARVVMESNGFDQTKIDRILSEMPDGLPVATMNKLLGDITSTANTLTREDRKDQRSKEVSDRQDQRIKLRGEIQSDLLEKGKALSLKNNMAIKQVIFSHATALQQGRLDAATKLAEEKDARALEGRLTALTQKQTFTTEENALKRDAAYALQVLKGEQALDLEGLRHINKVALENHKVGHAKTDTLKKFYLDFMKKNPAVADQLLDLISSSPDGIDPFTDEGVRSALAERFGSIMNSQVVSERIRTTIDTDLYGNTLQERIESLDAAKNRFLQGDPLNGVPPMSYEDVKPIIERIEHMEETLKLGSKSSNVTVNLNEKPMNTQDAFRFSALQQSLSELNTVEDILFDEEGRLDRSVIATGTEFNIPLTDISIQGLPFSKGRDMLQAIKNVVEARLRAETGAAAPEQEVDRAAQRFVPNNLDSEKAVRAKIRRLRDFATGAISLVDPVGTQRLRSSSPTPIQELREPAKGKSAEQRYNEIKQRNPSWEDEQVYKQLMEEGF